MPVAFPSQVVCGVDFSDVSGEALRLAVLLAKTARAPIGCVHAVDRQAPLYFTPANLPELERQNRRALVQEHAVLKAFASRITDAADVDLRVGEGHAAALILETADETRADLIVVGTTGRSGVERFWLGSVAEAVVRDARVPVLVVPRSAGPKTGKVICIVTNSGVSRTVLNRSATLAGELGAELMVVNVLDRERSGRTAEDLCAWASAECGCAVQYVEKRAHGQARLLDHIGGTGADLIVLGFEREGFFVRTEHGSSISDALRQAHAPILLIPKEYALEPNTQAGV